MARLRLTITYTLTCGFCGRKRTIQVTSGSARTVTCYCGHSTWRLR